MNEMIPVSSPKGACIRIFFSSLLYVGTNHRFLSGRASSSHYIYASSKRGQWRPLPCDAPLSGKRTISLAGPLIHAAGSSLCIRYSTSTSFVRGITKSLYMATTASTLILLCSAPTPTEGSVP